MPPDEQSQPLTTFFTLIGHWEFVSMQAELTSSPITFTWLMTAVFKMLGREVLVYISDIAVMSPDVMTQLQHLEPVLVKLMEANLRLGVNKCKFLQSEIKYIGHVIDRRGVSTNSSKIGPVADYLLFKI